MLVLYRQWCPVNDYSLPPDGSLCHYTLSSIDDSKSKDIQHWMALEIKACVKYYWIKSRGRDLYVGRPLYWKSSPKGYTEGK